MPAVDSVCGAEDSKEISFWDNNHNNWRFRAGPRRGQVPPISECIEIHSSHSHAYVAYHSPRSPGAVVRMTGWRRELNPQPADRRKRDQLPRPPGHPAPSFQDRYLKKKRTIDMQGDYMFLHPLHPLLLQTIIHYVMSLTMWSASSGEHCEYYVVECYWHFPRHQIKKSQKCILQNGMLSATGLFKTNRIQTRLNPFGLKNACG